MRVEVRFKLESEAFQDKVYILCSRLYGKLLRFIKSVGERLLDSWLKSFNFCKFYLNGTIQSKAILIVYYYEEQIILQIM